MRIRQWAGRGALLLTAVALLSCALQLELEITDALFYISAVVLNGSKLTLELGDPVLVVGDGELGDQCRDTSGGVFDLGELDAD